MTAQTISNRHSHGTASVFVRLDSVRRLVTRPQLQHREIRVAVPSRRCDLQALRSRNDKFGVHCTVWIFRNASCFWNDRVSDRLVGGQTRLDVGRIWIEWAENEQVH